MTWPIAVLTAVASAGGVFLPSTYAKETTSWAAQGFGQDVANLLIVLPTIVVAAIGAQRGSLRGLLVWIGVLLYLVYSYALYALFVHFNALFLVYVAALGCSFYALIGTVLTIDRDAIRSALHANAGAGAMSVLLMTVGALFTMLWLSDIVGALARGAAPAGVDEIGLPVNPVHVLDLAFALPGMMLTAALLRRRNVYGLLFAVPCAVFLATMGLAMVAMVFVQQARGVAVPLVLPIAVGITTAASVYCTYRFLRDIRRQPPATGAASETV